MWQLLSVQKLLIWAEAYGTTKRCHQVFWDSGSICRPAGTLHAECRLVSEGANLNRSLDLPKYTNLTITPRSGSVQMVIQYYCSLHLTSIWICLCSTYLPKVTWENDLTECACVTSRAGFSSSSICCLWEEGAKLPTCGLRAVSPLIIIISFSYNGCLIKSDSFVHRRGERGRDKRAPGVFRLRMWNDVVRH